jgi:hypothetical protein
VLDLAAPVVRSRVRVGGGWTSLGFRVGSYRTLNAPIACCLAHSQPLLTRFTLHARPLPLLLLLLLHIHIRIINKPGK